MRHGAIHGETNSCPKAIHARKGNSLAIGCHAAPTLGGGHGGYPERDVEGAVPYKGAVEMVRCHRRGGNLPPANAGS